MPDQALLARVEQERGSSSQRRPAALSDVVDRRRVEALEKLVITPKRPQPPRGIPVHLVIAYQECESVGPGKRGHHVVSGRHVETVVHALAHARDDRVAEALRQREQALGVVDQWAEAEDRCGKQAVQAIGTPQTGEAQGDARCGSEEASP